MGEAKGMGFPRIVAISNGVMALSHKQCNGDKGKKASRVAMVFPGVDTKIYMPMKHPTSKDA